MLIFKKGNSMILEPSYPYRFARNLRYDQSVPPNTEFIIPYRVYEFRDAQLVAGDWWDFFYRAGNDTSFVILHPGTIGCINRAYADWWRTHGCNFWVC